MEYSSKTTHNMFNICVQVKAAARRPFYISSHKTFLFPFFFFTVFLFYLSNIAQINEYKQLGATEFSSNFHSLEVHLVFWKIVEITIL